MGYSFIIEMALNSDEYEQMPEFDSDEYRKCLSDVRRTLNDERLFNRFDEVVSDEIGNVKSLAFIMGFKMAFKLAKEVFS